MFSLLLYRKTRGGEGRPSGRQQTLRRSEKPRGRTLSDPAAVPDAEFRLLEQVVAVHHDSSGALVPAEPPKHHGPPILIARRAVLLSPLSRWPLACRRGLGARGEPGQADHREHE